ncbi:unnamed protein product [Calypogeia fissa]
MEESVAKGMETTTEAAVAAASAEKTASATVEPNASLSSETDESLAKVDCPDGEDLSSSEEKKKKKKRMGKVCRVLICYLRKMSPARVLRKMRDCYVDTLGSCAQNYVLSPPYGMGLISCHAPPVPPSLLSSGIDHEDLRGSEFCLSPAFKKSFNESLLQLKAAGAFVDTDPGASPFRKSFSDFESCVSVKMRRTYSDAAAVYSRPGRRNSRSGYCGRSPGWAPSRALGGQAMMIFPIQEAPELILASFRKEAQELRLASFRKEVAEAGLPHRKDGELAALTEEVMQLANASKSQAKEGFEVPPASTEAPAAV